MIYYHIDARDTHAHLFHITVLISQPKSIERLYLPVWIPGSYMVRDFSKQLHDIQAKQDQQALNVVMTGKSSWEVQCKGISTLEITYSVYAFDTSVRAAYLNTQRGFFNGTSVFVWLEGRTEEVHYLTLSQLPQGWSIATTLNPEQINSQGLGLYSAKNYAELVDHPVEMGTFWLAHFAAYNIPHQLVVSGTFSEFDQQRLLNDLKKICEMEIDFWHPNQKPPFDKYLFLLNLTDAGFGGLEHRNSTALLFERNSLPKVNTEAAPEGYCQLLSLLSHEYFHAWNVVRLRPTEFGKLHLQTEQYTRLLWFSEGFTSYYEDIFLVRSKLITEAQYLKKLSKRICSLLDSPGRFKQSLADASLEAWTKFYRPDEGSPNITVNYYTKGALVAFALDVRLRSQFNSSLDQLMRLLWERCEQKLVSENDIHSLVTELANISLADELIRWVHETHELPWTSLFESFGLSWQISPPTVNDSWGIKTSESPLTGIKVKYVFRHSLGETIGLCPGDELLGLDAWRLRSMKDVAHYYLPTRPATLLICRDQLLHALKIPAAEQANTAYLSQPLAQGNLIIMPAAQAPKNAATLRSAWLHL